MSTTSSASQGFPLSTGQVEELSQLLSQRKALLENELKERLNDARRQGAEIGSHEVHDTKDASFLAAIAEVGVVGAERQIQELRDIETAFSRIRGGVYGVCSDCGGPIPHARLKVYPTAKRCRDCQQLKEDDQARRH